MPGNLSEKENTKSQVDTTYRRTVIFLLTFFHTSSGRMKETMQANLEEYLSDVLDQPYWEIL